MAASFSPASYTDTGQPAEAWLAEHALRDELLEGGLLEGRYNLTAGWRINNSIEASSLILRLRLAAQQGFDSTSPEQMAERDRECQDALMGYLERQLGYKRINGKDHVP